MTRDEIAQAIDGREYPFRMDDAFEDILKEQGFVVVFGESDDLMEFRGAVYDEVGAWDGTTAYLTNKGLLENDCDEGDCCPHFMEIKKNAATIKALWCKEDGFSWTFETGIPHSTFLIMEDGETYCRGIVFKLADVKALSA